MVKNRKAVLYSVIVIMVGLTLLELSFISSYFENNVDMGVIENVKTIKMLEVSDYVSFSIENIVKKATSLSLNYEEDKFVIKQKLPVDTIASELNGYKGFLEYFKVDNIVVNTNNILEFDILPLKANYTIDNNKISVKLPVIPSLDIIIDSILLNASPINWIQSTSGITQTKIIFKDAQGNVFEVVKNIDINGLNIIEMNGDNIKIDITINNGVVEIINHNNNVLSEVKIGSTSPESYFLVLKNMYNMLMDGLFLPGYVKFV